MKHVMFALVAFGLLSFGSTPKAEASICVASFKKAAVKCAADPKCQKAAAELLKKFKEQVKLCKAYRKMLKVCRKAKKSQKKECKAEKKACKNNCKGKKGKAKRQCKAACRKARRQCKAAARQTKRACKGEAKATKEFAICKDGRKMTRKAGGRFAACALKHFGPAALKCAAALAAGAG